MKARKGFTLVELMVVVLIVGILAAVAIPLMQGRIDAAKWSEAKAGAGTIVSSVRAYCAEKGAAASGVTPVLTTTLGFAAKDLDGTYFTQACYTPSAITVNADGSINFTVTINAASGTANAPTTAPLSRTLTVTNNVATFSW